MITPELSKTVGWDQRELNYPSKSQVEYATDYRLLEWHRFLKSPENEEQIEITELIIDRLWKGET